MQPPGRPGWLVAAWALWTCPPTRTTTAANPTAPTLPAQRKSDLIRPPRVIPTAGEARRSTAPIMARPPPIPGSNTPTERDEYLTRCQFTSGIDPAPGRTERRESPRGLECCNRSRTPRPDPLSPGAAWTQRRTAPKALSSRADRPDPGPPARRPARRRPPDHIPVSAPREPPNPPGERGRHRRA